MSRPLLQAPFVVLRFKQEADWSTSLRPPQGVLIRQQQQQEQQQDQEEHEEDGLFQAALMCVFLVGPLSGTGVNGVDGAVRRGDARFAEPPIMRRAALGLRPKGPTD